MNTLDLADLDDLQRDEARKLLPVVRQVLRDMLAAERAEYSASAREPDSAHAPTPFTADDLAAAEAELRRALSAQPTPDAPSLPRLLVCIGPDPDLTVDLAMLRAVRAETGLAFHRMTNAASVDLQAVLRRQRAQGRPVRWLHLACHAGPEGVLFADGLVDGEWLSARLQGVQVLMLAACNSDRVGDWLTVVPHVVSLADEIDHADAAALTRHFWHAMGSNLDPGAALDRALERCAPVVAEFVVRHW